MMFDEFLIKYEPEDPADILIAESFLFFAFSFSICCWQSLINAKNSS